LGWHVLRLWEHDVVATTEAVAASIAHRHRLEDTADWRVRSVVVLDPTTDLEEQQLVRLRDPNCTMGRRRLRSTRAWPIAELARGSSSET
jgi:hypothetical protein